MKKIFRLILLGFATYLFIPPVMADTYVHGYVRRDGTYVAPHWRSSPDSSYNNNWSVQGNVNPYTGKEGTRSPTWNDKTPYENNKYGNPGYMSPSDNSGSNDTSRNEGGD